MAKLTDKQITAAVEKICDLYDQETASFKASDFVGTIKIGEQKREAFNELKSLTQDIKELTPGMLVQWCVADGYASYVIVQTGKKTCKLVHIPEGDSYHFSGINANGQILTSTLREKIECDKIIAEALGR